ncbi:ABC transporter ATP-binding protein [Methanoplanus sp. FWC-SCC4]|uniref:ABC transporter ATP-binding protein n=1 Tax=Methanochimaera problematica TaxID=2609417 RepID=A0AA97I360_9EURY|nr:ABC transporter ATP-binding protein [Methanoplanus sp. FWC-SCC4]WOF17010.1 ABC transporter ATP-binding protein [Methanoplanus sp. FWC-SCC4]
MIEFRHLVKEYNGVRAVDDLCLTIGDGEIYGLLGPNGAGKSTTILMLIGLIQPTSGECLVNGVEVSKNPIEVKKQIGYMPEDVGFYTNLDAWQNLEYSASFYGLSGEEADERIEYLLGLVGLKGVTKKVGGYSKGMRQRLGVAKALINNPSVVVLDEPTANLDPQGVSDYRSILRDVAKEGKTILVSSHILAEVSKVSTKIGILQRGRLIREGTWEELANAIGDLNLPEIRINIETRSKMPEFSHPDIVSADYRKDGTVAHIVAKSDIRDQLADVLYKNNIAPRQIGLDSITLEDAILSYYNE